MEIPSSAAGITAEWLSGVLEVAPGGPFGPVERVEPQRIGEGAGVLTEIYRLRITYAPAGTPGPATLVVKLPGSTPKARALSDNYGFYEREVALYRDIASNVSIGVPACFGADFDPVSRRFVLLLDDLADATPTDRIFGLSEVQIRKAVRELGALHARWWRDPQLSALEAVIPVHGQAPYDSLGRMHAACWEGVAPWMARNVGPDMMRVGERFCTELEGLIARNGEGQRTLCHGDNMLFSGDPGDPRITILDWQIMLQGPGTFDIGYLMSNNVTTDLRRDLELRLLPAYHAQLLAGGVEGYGFEECLEDCRRALLITFTYVVQAVSVVDIANPRFDHLFSTLSKRCEAACQDHGLASMLG